MKIDIHYVYSAKYAKWLIITLCSLFTVLIISEYLSLLFVKTPILTSTSIEKPLSHIQKPDVFSQLRNSTLFGLYISDDLNEDNVKKSMLNLTLVGILLGNQPDESQVIIRTASGEEKTYKTGDNIPGGASINRIMDGGILVEREGVLESLSLPKNELIFEPIAKPLPQTEE